jgi:hypothetical protein
VKLLRGDQPGASALLSEPPISSMPDRNKGWESYRGTYNSDRGKWLVHGPSRRSEESNLVQQPKFPHRQQDGGLTTPTRSVSRKESTAAG